MIQRVIRSLAVSLTFGNSKGLALVKRCVHGMSRVLFQVPIAYGKAVPSALCCPISKNPENF